MSQETPTVDLSQARRRAEQSQGEAMWRSLDELAQTDGFRQSLEREFPASYWDFVNDDTTRRNFLRLMGASMALAGVYGCSERPSRKILPYVQPPEQIVPGMPLFFATAMPFNGYGYGVLAESHEGRPTKIEGNPDHPASLGRSNIFMQASVLQLYDPERLNNVLRAGSITTWGVFAGELSDRLEASRRSGGQGVRILTGTVTSPTLAGQLKEFLRQFPRAKWCHYDPMARVNTRQGATLAFGKPLATAYRFRRSEGEQPVDAKVVVSFDSDFLWAEPGSLQYAKHFAAARKVRVRHSWHTTMSRAYVVESGFTLTGSMADHRIPARPAEVAAFVEALAQRLGVQNASARVPAAWEKHLDAMASDLQQNKGESIVLVGESLPPEMHRLGHAINAALGNVGKTVYYTEPVEFFPEADGQPVTGTESLRQLVQDMNRGEVDTLLILGENPAYTAPADLKFAEALDRLTRSIAGNSPGTGPFTAHLGLYNDETSFLCRWALPEAHYLESWGDVRAFDGTASIIQPLIAPMFQGRSAIEVMDTVLNRPSNPSYRTGYEIVREHWLPEVKEDPEAWWSQSLEKGVIAGTQFPEVQASLAAAGSAGASAAGTSSETPATTRPSTRPSGVGELDVIFRPDPSVWDGQFSNNGWLQECPKFFTKLVWTNAALISPGTADALRAGGNYAILNDGQVFTFTTPDGLEISAPVTILPGVPDGVVIMHFGYGRTRGGTSATESDGKTPRGFNAYAMRHSSSPWDARGVRAAKTDRTAVLVVTHNHYAMSNLPGFGPKDLRGDLKPHAVEHPGMEESELETNNRRIIRTATLEYFNASPEHRHFVKELGSEGERKPLLSMYPGWDYKHGYQWGMSIDIQSCIGCNACLVACVAENNIAVVGAEEVARQREMHWIRIDDYFAGDLHNPRVYHQPVPCMHCENAPCEVVCPVGATVHSSEGINMMVYNRCVGTRYCSNNCPYKVRRFNFFNWMKGGAESFDLQHNPEVTVRSRGVMEKCTYCIQRVQRTRIEIEKMIVRREETIRELREEQKTASPEAREQLERRIQKLWRDRHNEEFDGLERLQTACQQSCPTDAITFGNILPVDVVNEKGEKVQRLTEVTKLKQEPLDYPLLAELTTVPRTTYMARLRNPNPELEPGAQS